MSHEYQSVWHTMPRSRLIERLVKQAHSLPMDTNELSRMHRKFRLALVAIARQTTDYEVAQLEAINFAEEVADVPLTVHDHSTREINHRLHWRRLGALASIQRGMLKAHLAAACCISVDTCVSRSWSLGNDRLLTNIPRITLSMILNDIFGDWYRYPVYSGVYPEFVKLDGPSEWIEDSVLQWNSGKVVEMANAIYEAKTFDELVILADAAEDAGCTSRRLLDHLRPPQCGRCGGKKVIPISKVSKNTQTCPLCNGTGIEKRIHNRGCWALDVLRGG